MFKSLSANASSSSNNRIFLDIPDFTSSFKHKKELLLKMSEVCELKDFIDLHQDLCDKEFQISSHLLKIYEENFENLKKICAISIKATEYFGEKLKLNRSGDYEPIVLSKSKIGCLLGLMLLGFFKKHPSSNFQIIRNFAFFQTKLSCKEQLKCIFSYFKIFFKMEEGEREKQKVVFRRHKLKKEFTEILDPESKVPGGEREGGSPLSEFLFDSSKRIEDFKDAVNIDFANKFIGGIVLTGGLMQEEIRLLVSPESLVSILIFEKMADNEAIHIIGAERYIEYEGFSNSFRLKCEIVDPSPQFDSVKLTAISAIDAIVAFGWRDKGGQYSKAAINRELIKAVSGFALGDYDEEAAAKDFAALNLQLKKMSVATGKWGCGVFGGDPELKFLIQLAAATVNKRQLFFSSYGDRELEEKGNRLKPLLKGKTLGFLLNFLYSLDVKTATSVFDHLERSLI